MAPRSGAHAYRSTARPIPFEIFERSADPPWRIAPGGSASSSSRLPSCRPPTSLPPAPLLPRLPFHVPALRHRSAMIPTPPALHEHLLHSRGLSGRRRDGARRRPPLRWSSASPSMAAASPFGAPRMLPPGAPLWGCSPSSPAVGVSLRSQPPPAAFTLPRLPRGARGATEPGSPTSLAPNGRPPWTTPPAARATVARGRSTGHPPLAARARSHLPSITDFFRFSLFPLCASSPRPEGRFSHPFYVFIPSVPVWRRVARSSGVCGCCPVWPPPLHSGAETGLVRWSRRPASGRDTPCVTPPLFGGLYRDLSMSQARHRFYHRP